jgi:TetR/AcrR family transcriptional regulator, cholesterol catabolism regulator
VPRDGRIAPQRNDELVNVAATLFRERGYDATSMQEIADEMGILKGSVYHYVKTKEDLLWMVAEPVLLDLVGRAQEILGDEETPLPDRLAAAMEAHAVCFEDHFPHMFVMTRENGETLSDKRRDDIDGLRRKYFQIWRDAIVEGQESGIVRDDVRPSIAVHGIFGMINWMFRWFKPGGRASASDVAGQFALIAVEGLTAKQS